MLSAALAREAEICTATGKAAVMQSLVRLLPSLSSFSHSSILLRMSMTHSPIVTPGIYLPMAGQLLRLKIGVI